jgi:multidrug efflux pump subunit AcrB
VTSPIVAATVTSLASVVPFLLITGLSALVFRELILTVSISHLASLPVALTLVPMLAAQLGKIRSPAARALRAARRVRSRLQRMVRRYRKVAGGAVKHPYLVLGRRWRSALARASSRERSTRSSCRWWTTASCRRTCACRRYAA